ncbi:MAG: type II secretion system F family protein [Candidatus Gracilibacteria bacterium]|nr:type II secretion system F family protein [Candidatus Peregrinibacteria bacterium]
MPEKQAKGFGFGEKDQMFELGQLKQTPEAPKKKSLLLDIAESRAAKILLKQRGGDIRLTGNPIIDTFKRLNQFLIDHSKVKTKEKAIFFRLLSVMLNAGLPLVRSLNTLGVQMEKTPKLSNTLFEMGKAIEGGSSLSEAMQSYPEIFQDAEVGVVKAGEASGQLNNTLKSLANDVEKAASIAGKVKGALIYPTVILSLLVVAIFLMMILVVPQITKLFTQTGNELPLPTRILIFMSEFSVQYWPVLLGVAVLFVIGFGWYRTTRSGRFVLDWLKLHAPIFGDLFRKAALSKFARGFANLMSSGVPIIKSIEIVSHSIGNEVYKRRLVLTSEDMKRGIPMAENLSNSKLFPKMLVNMVEVGEQTAQLENVMEKVADFYDEEIDTMVNSLSKIMEPLILVVIGVTVGGLVAAIMLPIMQLTDLSGTF